MSQRIVPVLVFDTAVQVGGTLVVIGFGFVVQTATRTVFGADILSIRKPGL